MTDTARRGLRTGLAAGSATLVFAVVVAIGFAIVANPQWSAWEVGLVEAVHSQASPVATAVALTINVVFGPKGAALVALGACGLVIVRTRSWTRGLQLAPVIVIPWFIAEMTKEIVRRPRPDPAIVDPLLIPQPSSFSYPSGHTAFATALVVSVVVFATAKKSRRVALVVGAAVILLTAWSRVYLGVHYPTDVAASVIMVSATAIATAMIVQAFFPHTPPKTGTPGNLPDEQTAESKP